MAFVWHGVNIKKDIMDYLEKKPPLTDEFRQ